MNVLEIEGSCSRLLEKSTATVCIWAFPFMSFPYAYCCGLICSMYLLVCIISSVCIIHFSHTYADVIVGFTYK